MSEEFKHNQLHWSSCPEMQEIIEGQSDLRGTKFGKFTVIGKHRKKKRIGVLWVVRCECGHYEIRSTKSVNNPFNFGDRCECCRADANEKRRQIRKMVKYGTEIDARKL